MSEKWKEIVELENKYEISNLGNIRTKDRYVKSKPGLTRYVPSISTPLHVGRSGYLFGEFYISNNKHVRKDVHRLVAKYFIKNHENKRCVNHLDGNKLNNKFYNLEWVTDSENQQHAINIGLRKDRGENSKNSKLTKDIILEIREHYNSGNYTYKQIGEKFKIHRDYIGLIINKKRWNYV